MKKALRYILALAMVATMTIGLSGTVSATPGEQNGDSLSITNPEGGASIHVTLLATGELDFNYGWSNVDKFAKAPVGYWIGVYDVTDSHYVWATENPFAGTPQNPQNGGTPPKVLKLNSIDETTLISGHTYYINFFIRSNYATNPFTNVVTITLTFVAP